MKRLARFLALAVAAAALAGCATSYKLENDVQTFASTPALPTPATYRFERLPSQQVHPGQTALEALAEPALQKAGLQRDDTNPRMSVQVLARTERTLSPFSEPWASGRITAPDYPACSKPRCRASRTRRAGCAAWTSWSAVRTNNLQ
jgi:hypothetical protein